MAVHAHLKNGFTEVEKCHDLLSLLKYPSYLFQYAYCLIAGLLTVDPKKRLTMEDLTKNEWLLRNNESIFPQNTLRTPGVLSHGSNYLQFQISATMNAYHKAEREGFRLQDVNKAPLAQRRKKKKDSVDGRSESSDSSNSTHSSGSQVNSQSLLGAVAVGSPRDSPVRNLSNNSNQSNTSNTSSASYSSTHSLGFVPHKISPIDLVSSQQSEAIPQDIVVLHTDLSANQAPPVQEIRSSSESDGPSEKQPFQGYRGTKRKHSLEEESEFEDYDEENDSDYSGNDCIIIDDEDEESDDSLKEALPSSLTEAVPRKKPRTDMGPIVIDD